jgi:hypothetical protein
MLCGSNSQPAIIKEFGTHVDDPHDLPPQRSPLEMAALAATDEFNALSGTERRNHYFMAAVSSWTPSPTAPKSFTLRKTR